MTGLSTQSDELWRKKISLLGEAVSSLRRVAIMGETSTKCGLERLSRAVVDAESAELEVITLGVQRSGDLRPALEQGVADGAQGLLLLEDVALVGRQRSAIAYYALRAGIPTIAPDRSYADDGILMSYGANVQALQRRVARYVRRLLDGADPSSLPVEQPSHFELVVNLATAEQLGLELPPTLLLRANDVIE